METLAGDNDLEVVTSGGVSENVVGTLATLPYLIRVSPRIEDYAVIADTKKSASTDWAGSCRGGQRLRAKSVTKN